MRNLIGYTDEKFEFTDAQKQILIKAINDCRILDPACGSGAFPMGMLQRMIHILKKLDPENKVWLNMVVANFPEYMQHEMRKKLEVENWDYVRKIGIIQECIYGVDIQPIATQISKLRFFISLLVDQKEKPNKTNRGFDPLPNLDFKLVTANTLIAPPETDEVTTGLFAGTEDAFYKEFEKLTARYFSTYKPDEKKKVREEIERLITNKCSEKIKQIENLTKAPDEKTRKALQEKYKDRIANKENEIALWESYKNLFKQEAVRFFDVKYFFPNVKDGFDIVIGNPPYGILNKKQNKSESIIVSEEDLNYFKNSEYYKPATGGMLNIFRLFILKSIRLLTEGGVFSEIFPLAFTGDLSISNLRKYILENTQILSIEAFPERDNPNKRVFEAVKMSVCILNLKNSKGSAPFFIRINDDKFVNELLPKSFLKYEIIKTLDKENFNFPLTLPNETKLLVKIFKASKRFEEIGKCNTGEIDMTFCKSAFSNNIKNSILLKGAIIDRYLLRTKMSQGEIVFIDEKKLLTLKNINPDFKEQSRIVLQGITGVNEKTRLKMMIVKDAYCANSLNYLTINEHINKKFLLGLFNSKLLNFVFSKFSTNSNVNGYEVDNLPIVVAKESAQQTLVTIVDKILSAKEKNPQADTSDLEKQIDEMVYKLYDLTEEEIKIIEGN